MMTLSHRATDLHGRTTRSGVVAVLLFLCLILGAAPSVRAEDPHGDEGHHDTHAAETHGESHGGDHAADAGHGADSHGGDHGDGHGKAAKKHEEAPVIHIASIFDLIKAWNRDTYDIKHHIEEAYHEIHALEAEIEAATLAGETAQVKELEHQLESAEHHLKDYKQQYYRQSFWSRAGIWVYKHSYGIIALVIIGAWFWLAVKMGGGAALRPGRVGTVAELFTRGLYDLYEPVLGKDEIRRYFPFLASMFCFILFNNLMSLIPFSKSPSAVFFNNLGLGIIVFFYVQYIGITRCGPKDYFLHFLGNPQGFIGWFLGIFLLLPLEILAELVRPISLSLRLFGNIMGEDILLLVFCTIGLSLSGAMLGPVGEGLPFGIPMHALLYPIILLGCTLQALVFTILTAVYISLKLPHDHHHDDEHGEHAHAH